MPLPPTKLTITKLYQGESWDNVYYLSTEFGSSASAANSIVAAERAITRSPILFTKYRMETTTEGDEAYATIPVNLFGLLTIGTDTLLPLFNVLRVDIAAGVGRPSRKYLRGVLVEGVVNFNTIDSGFVSLAQSDYADVVAGVTSYVDVDGDIMGTAVVHPFVGMRQLRRASKKKTTPAEPIPV